MNEQPNSWTEEELMHSYVIACIVCKAPINHFCHAIRWDAGTPSVVVRPEGPHARRIKLALKYVPMEDQS